MLLNVPPTTIHKVDVDSNNYGEFLFVTVSRPEEEGPQLLTFLDWGITSIENAGTRRSGHGFVLTPFQRQWN